MSDEEFALNGHRLTRMGETSMGSAGKLYTFRCSGCSQTATAGSFEAGYPCHATKNPEVA